MGENQACKIISKFQAFLTGVFFTSERGGRRGEGEKREREGKKGETRRRKGKMRKMGGGRRSPVRGWQSKTRICEIKPSK